MKDTHIYRWVPASEFKFQENTLYFAENREPGLELYKIAVEYVNRMSVNGKEFLKNGKELFWKHLNDWDNLYIQEELPQSIPLTKEVKETAENSQRAINVIENWLNDDRMTFPDWQPLKQKLESLKSEYASQFSTSVPVSEPVCNCFQELSDTPCVHLQKIMKSVPIEVANVYRSEGWDACHSYILNVDQDGLLPPNKEMFLNSYSPKKP